MYNIGCWVHSNCLQIIAFIQNYNIQTRLTVSQAAKKPNNLFVFYEKKASEKKYVHTLLFHNPKLSKTNFYQAQHTKQKQKHQEANQKQSCRLSNAALIS